MRLLVNPVETSSRRGQKTMTVRDRPCIDAWIRVGPYRRVARWLMWRRKPGSTCVMWLGRFSSRAHCDQVVLAEWATSEVVATDRVRLAEHDLVAAVHAHREGPWWDSPAKAGRALAPWPGRPASRTGSTTPARWSARGGLLSRTAAIDRQQTGPPRPRWPPTTSSRSSRSAAAQVRADPGRLGRCRGILGSATYRRGR
jgi:hypothetical protein